MFIYLCSARLIHPEIRLISKEDSLTEHEYMNIHSSYLKLYLPTALVA